MSKQEHRVVVLRHNIAAMELEAAGGFNRMPILLTGGTGSGKTTTAQLPFLKHVRGKKVLYIQPTAANVGNSLYEWSNLVPQLVANTPSLRKYQDKYDVPTSTTLAAMNTATSGVFFVKSADALSMLINGSLSTFDYVVLDEQHLPLQSQRTILTYLRYKPSLRNYMTISATPDGKVVAAERPRNVSVVNVNYALGVFEESNNFQTNVSIVPGYHLERNPTRRDFNVAIVMPTLMMLESYAERLREDQVAGGRIFIITEQTSEQAFSRLRRATERGRNVILMLPAVEAGITLRMDVMIDLGYGYATVVDKSVSYDQIIPITADQSAQRRGRAGRVVPTTVIVNQYRPVIRSLKDNSADDFLEANAIVTCVGTGIPITAFRRTRAYKKFARLQSLTESAAKAAMTDSPARPFAASYKYDLNGILFRECGGTATGFSALAKADLKIFIANGATENDSREMIALPIFDLTNPEFDPWSFVARDQQQSVIEALADTERAMIAQFTLQRQIDIMIPVWNDFKTLILSALRTGFDPRPPAQQGTWVFDEDLPDEMSRMHAVCDRGSDLDYLVTQLITRTPDVRYREDQLQVTQAGALLPDRAATANRDTAARQAHDDITLGLRDALDRDRERMRKATEELDDFDDCLTTFRNIVETRALAAEVAENVTQNNLALAAHNAAVAQATANNQPPPPAPVAIPAPTQPTDPYRHDAATNFYALMRDVARGYRNNLFRHYDTTEWDTYHMYFRANPPTGNHAAVNQVNNVRRAPFALLHWMFEEYTGGYDWPSGEAAVRDMRTDRANRQAALAASITAAEAQLQARGPFRPDPNPIMAPSRRAEYKFNPWIEVDVGGTVTQISLVPDLRFKVAERNGRNVFDLTQLTNAVMSILRPRIALARMRQIQPDRFVELSEFKRMAPRTHKWFWSSVH